MYKLNDYEKETIILFNEEEEYAYIDTFDEKLRKRLIEYSEKYPDFCRYEKTDEFGMSSFTIYKNRLSIRLIPPMTTEQREKAVQRGKEYGFKKK